MGRILPTMEGDEEGPVALEVVDEAPEEEQKRVPGRRKSGRVWKEELGQPASRKRANKVHHSSWKAKLERKAEYDRIREMERIRQEEIEAAREAVRQKRAEKKRRRELNECKSEQTQELNPKRLRQKLKTMSKKQKRQ